MVGIGKAVAVAAAILAAAGLGVYGGDEARGPARGGSTFGYETPRDTSGFSTIQTLTFWFKQKRVDGIAISQITTS